MALVASTVEASSASLVNVIIDGGHHALFVGLFLCKSDLNGVVVRNSDAEVLAGENNYGPRGWKTARKSGEPASRPFSLRFERAPQRKPPCPRLTFLAPVDVSWESLINRPEVDSLTDTTTTGNLVLVKLVQLFCYVAGRRRHA